MLTFAYYLLKVLICSGILYGYYLLALRNKIFHQWNRFYLLAAVVLSLAAPLIKINIWQNSNNSKTGVVQLLQVVNGGDEIVFEYSKDRGIFQINASNLSLAIYVIVSSLLLAFLIKTLLRINRLKKDNHNSVIEGINFINTQASGTPFSFFNNIFWNDKIDINTSTGKQIFNHEVAHVKEKHSYDKVFMNVVLIGFWYNPFFLLLRKELNMIHEFIADKKALEESDTAAFAAMILQATYPRQQFIIANNFFYSPLKRRLAMITKNRNPRFTYLSRLLVMPLAALVFFAFTLKMKTFHPTHYTGKKLTVVIDAGHGGEDGGARSESGLYEKELTLSIAKKIKELNANTDLNIVLSRDADVTISVKQRVETAKSLHADLFISIHVDAEMNKNTKSGLGILIPNDDNAYLLESKILGGDINAGFKNNYQLPAANDLKQWGKGIWVLKANEWPAILIEAGFLTNQKDIEYLIKEENQKIIAQNILNGIEKYAKGKIAVKYLIQDKSDVSMMDTISNKKADFSIKDTVPQTKIKTSGADKALIIVDGVEKGNDKKYLNSIEPSSIESISVLKGESAIKKYGEKGKDGVIEIITKTKEDIIVMKAEKIIVNDDEITANNIIIINGQMQDKEKLKGKTIQAKGNVRVYGPNNSEAIKLYGELAKNGVKVFTDAVITDKSPVTKTDTIPKFDRIFTKVENEAQFPGGQQAWTKFITNIIKTNIDAIVTDNKTGTCRVRFIVDNEGNISAVEALTMKGTELAKVSVDAIKNGPKWEPAKQNGNIVVSYREQPITFTMQEN